MIACNQDFCLFHMLYFKNVELMGNNNDVLIILPQHACIGKPIKTCLPGHENIDKLGDMDVVGSSGASASVPEAHDKHVQSIIYIYIYIYS